MLRDRGVFLFVDNFRRLQAYPRGARSFAGRTVGLKHTPWIEAGGLRVAASFSLETPRIGRDGGALRRHRSLSRSLGSWEGACAPVVWGDAGFQAGSVSRVRAPFFGKKTRGEERSYGFWREGDRSRSLYSLHECGGRAGDALLSAPLSSARVSRAAARFRFSGGPRRSRYPSFRRSWLGEHRPRAYPSIAGFWEETPPFQGGRGCAPCRPGLCRPPGGSV